MLLLLLLLLLLLPLLVWVGLITQRSVRVHATWCGSRFSPVGEPRDCGGEEKRREPSTPTRHHRFVQPIKADSNEIFSIKPANFTSLLRAALLVRLISWDVFYTFHTSSIRNQTTARETLAQTQHQSVTGAH